MKILRESISSVTSANQWEMITKDLLKQEITGYRQVAHGTQLESCPKYYVNQLVTIKYNPKYKHLHKEIGIVVAVNDYDTFEGMGSLHFYEILVGDEKVTLIEKYIDSFDDENKDKN